MAGGLQNPTVANRHGGTSNGALLDACSTTSVAMVIVGMAAVRTTEKEVHMRKIIVTVAAVAIASAVGFPKSAEARNGGEIVAGVIGGFESSGKL